MIVFDIDDTLTHISERKECLRQEPKDWDGFYARCYEDKPNWPIVNLCRLIQSTGMPVAFVTSRTEETRGVTIEWLTNHDLWKFNSTLLMRPEGNKLPDEVLKPILVEKFQSSIVMVFEDRTRVVKKWREMGLTCLQVKQSDY